MVIIIIFLIYFKRNKTKDFHPKTLHIFVVVFRETHICVYDAMCDLWSLFPRTNKYVFRRWNGGGGGDSAFHHFPLHG